LRESGCDQILTVDLSKPEIGVSVVRAVIPGLEAPHDDDNYVAGPRAARAGKAES
jgi:ribosomal protein S12 methylthiotransferase accessory factor